MPSFVIQEQKGLRPPVEGNKKQENPKVTMELKEPGHPKSKTGGVEEHWPGANGKMPKMNVPGQPVGGKTGKVETHEKHGSKPGKVKAPGQNYSFKRMKVSRRGS